MSSNWKIKYKAQSHMMLRFWINLRIWTPKKSNNSSPPSSKWKVIQILPKTLRLMKLCRRFCRCNSNNKKKMESRGMMWSSRSQCKRMNLLLHHQLNKSLGRAARTTRLTSKHPLTINNKEYTIRLKSTNKAHLTVCPHYKESNLNHRRKKVIWTPLNCLNHPSLIVKIMS